MSKHFILLLAGTVVYVALLMMCADTGENQPSFEGRLVVRTYTILWWLRCTAGYLIFAVLTIGHKLLNPHPGRSNEDD